MKYPEMKANTSDNFLIEPLLPPPTAPIEDFCIHSNEYVEGEAPVVQQILRAEEVFLVNEASQNASPTINIPIGRWRDNLCGCCAHGCCHPNVICPLCFPLGAFL